MAKTPCTQINDVKDRKITVSIGKTFNMDNYESLRVDARMSWKIGDKEDFYDSYIVITEELTEALDNEIKKLAKNFEIKY